MWILRLPELHRFSTRPIVLPIFYVCYWIRFYVVRTEISLALPCRVHRHSLFSAITVYLMGHTAEQSSVAEDFCLNRQRCLQSQLKWLTRRPALKSHQLLKLLSASRIPTYFGATLASLTTCDEWSGQLHSAITVMMLLAFITFHFCAFRFRYPAGIGDLWP